MFFQIKVLLTSCACQSVWAFQRHHPTFSRGFHTASQFLGRLVGVQEEGGGQWSLWPHVGVVGQYPPACANCTGLCDWELRHEALSKAALCRLRLHLLVHIHLFQAELVRMVQRQPRCGVLDAR